MKALNTLSGVLDNITLDPSRLTEPFDEATTKTSDVVIFNLFKDVSYLTSGLMNVVAQSDTATVAEMIADDEETS